MCDHRFDVPKAQAAALPKPHAAARDGAGSAETEPLYTDYMFSEAEEVELSERYFWKHVFPKMNEAKRAAGTKWAQQNAQKKAKKKK